MSNEIFRALVPQKTNLTNETATYEEWLTEFKELSLEFGYSREHFHYFENEPAWKEYYDDGYTPENTLAEDASYGEP